MTPDVCQAWLLNEISNQAHRAFLARTRLMVVDEAHVLEGVFGSNFAYLFRRLCAARFLVQGKGRRTDLQVIAASATISSPDEHLNALTGLQFTTVGEEDDGAPRHNRSVMHITAAHRREADVGRVGAQIRLSRHRRTAVSLLSSTPARARNAWACPSRQRKPCEALSERLRGERQVDHRACAA